MVGTRVQVDLYFDGKTPSQVNQTFPGLLPIIKAAKAKASRVNAGSSNEEMSVKAVYHVCHNDINQPCEPSVEI